jgi:translation initiation factor IF-2
VRRTGVARVREPVTIRRRHGTIAARVTIVDGTFRRGDFARVVRGHQAVATGQLTGMKTGNQRAHQVSAEHECSVQMHPWFDFEPGDVIEGFQLTGA